MSKKNLDRESSAGSLTAAELDAAKRVNFPTEEIIEARRRMRGIASSHEKRVQYWALTDDLVWKPEQKHERLFLAVRLIIEYKAAPDRMISERHERIRKLADLAHRLASELPEVLPEGPTLLALDRLSQPAASAN